MTGNQRRKRAMSAVSSESPQSADLSEAASTSGPEGELPEHPGDGTARKDFGPNEWLVDELYQRYLADPGSVDMAWWNFFADYTPPAGSQAGGNHARAAAARARAPAAPRPPRPPARRSPARLARGPAGHPARCAALPARPGRRGQHLPA